LTIRLNEIESANLKIENETVEVFFRRPNAEEMVAYLAGILSGDNPENLESLLKSGIRLARSCILGVRKGDIILEDGEPLVTDEKDEKIFPGWKALLEEKLPGLMLMLANHLVGRARAELEVREKN
jgi:hypothetical protein